MKEEVSSMVRNSKLVVFLLAGVLTLAVWPGLTRAETIRWWVWEWDSPWQEETWTAAVQAFEAQTGINVQIETVVWDQIASKLRAASIAGNPPDVAMILHADYAWLARGGFLADITSVAQSDLDLGDFKADALQSVTLDDRLYGLPWRRVGYALVCNTSLLKEVGILYPPNTLDELKVYAARVTESLDGVYGWGMPLGRASAAFYRWENVFFSYGGDWLNEDGTAPADNFLEAATKAFQFHLDMAKYTQPTLIEDTDDDVIRLAAAGKIAMWQDHMSAMATIEALFGSEGVKALEYAYFPEGKYDAASRTSYRYTSVGGWDIVIPAGTKSFDAAWQFVMFWVSAENMGATTLGLPTRISSMQHPRIAVIPDPFKFGAIKTTLTVPGAAEVKNVVWEQLQAVVLGQVSPADAAETVYNKLVDVIGR